MQLALVQPDAVGADLRFEPLWQAVCCFYEQKIAIIIPDACSDVVELHTRAT